MAGSTLNGLSRCLEQDLKRERDHRHKWALGEAPATGGSSKRRPVHPHRSRGEKHGGVNFCGLCHTESVPSKNCQRSNKVRSSLKAECNPHDWHLREKLNSSVVFPSPLAPDSDYTYSFDNPTGPSQGADILGLALEKAVAQYETKATEQLVHNEYEVVAIDKEDERESSQEVEDDFELI